MPNTYFQFKQFRIEQGQSGMKVTTDGCFFGACIQTEPKAHILDIGTGTGLLTLMLAQKAPSATFDALEIDAAAYQEAKSNFEESPWKENISINHCAVQGFQPIEPYDMIICNPPFFNSNYKGQSANRNKAIHDDTLPAKDLANFGWQHLSDEGSLWVMYPAYEMEQFLHVARANGFHEKEHIRLRNKQDAPIFRKIVRLGKKKETTIKEQDVCIRNENGEYTHSFIDLLKDYYLHL